MAITYPLTMPPEVARAAKFMPRLKRATSLSESIFTAEQQVTSWPYARWEADWDIAASLRDKGSVVEGFIAALRGRRGTFLMGPLHALNPQGTVNTSGVQVNAAAATYATEVSLKGMGAGNTLRIGDYIQFGSGLGARLHIVSQDATANGSGVATVSIEPGLRGALAVNDPVVTQNMVGVWRLNADSIGPSIIPGFIYESLTLPCIEAV
ncbi:hypothetical protein [uncultured Alsobacter sp.]|uniref:hypothetical protein n=1 Tax=uncultured Alsobacter sp. TaxID=1748258 RepID=UPI0025EB7A11|nr:hypothetical protein [uncultured Alsobacter sp.]